MPTIPFPDVPTYPGVPALVRSAVNALSTEINVSLGSTQTALASAAQSSDQWGIFDSDGVSIWSPSDTAVLSTNTFEFLKETRIADFPIEQGSFANYNKVELPGNPVVNLALAGSESDRSSFLSAIDDACTSTDLFSVVTPEFTYYNYSVERYNYARRSERGATLLLVEISLKEIRQVSASYSTAQTSINQPQNPAAAPQTNGGLAQPAPPSPSTLKSLMSLFPSLGGN